MKKPFLNPNRFIGDEKMSLRFIEAPLEQGESGHIQFIKKANPMERGLYGDKTYFPPAEETGQRRIGMITDLKSTESAGLRIAGDSSSRRSSSTNSSSRTVRTSMRYLALKRTVSGSPE